MAVTIDPMRGGPSRQHQSGLAGEAVQESRGILDFASLVRRRGLLDAPSTAAMSSGSASTATRFDEGPLFGKATMASQEPATGQRQAVRNADTANDSLRAPGAFLSAESSRVEDPQSRTPAGQEGMLSPLRERATRGDRLVDLVPQNPARSDAAMDMPVSSGRLAPDAKGSGSVAARGEGFGSRARYVEQLGPVHVIARKGAAGVELTARVANMEEDQADGLERRLLKAAAEEGAWVSAVRLNGADRPSRSGGTGNG